MSWKPLGNQEISLKNDIKLKKFNPELFKSDAKEEHKNKQIDYVYKCLLNADNYKQAVAVLGAVAAVEDIKKVSEYGFNLIKDNSAVTIRATLGLIPAVLLQRKQAKIAQTNLNDHIKSYLKSISGKYQLHQSGKINENGLPFVKEGKNNWAVFYNNGLNKLPAGNNIEWYPYVGSTKSAHKRFFTHRSSPRLWFADGGTHGNVDDWWIQEVPDGDWKKL
jgi:hypothetical protein